MKKNFGIQILAKQAKIVPKIRFFLHFLMFVSLVVLEIAYSNSFQQCLTSLRGKTNEKKNNGGLNLDQNWA